MGSIQVPHIQQSDGTKSLLSSMIRNAVRLISQAAELVKNAGDMMAVQMTIETPMAKTNGYFPRPDRWRGDPAFSVSLFLKLI